MPFLSSCFTERDEVCVTSSLCLFGQLTQQDCLQISAHNVTVHALNVPRLCHTKHPVPFAKTCPVLIGFLGGVI